MKHIKKAFDISVFIFSFVVFFGGLFLLIWWLWEFHYMFFPIERTE